MEGVKETEAQGKLSPEQEVVGSQEQGLLSLPPGPPPPSSHHVVPSLWMLCELHPRTPCLQLLVREVAAGAWLVLPQLLPVWWCWLTPSRTQGPSPPGSFLRISPKGRGTAQGSLGTEQSRGVRRTGVLPGRRRPGETEQTGSTRQSGRLRAWGSGIGDLGVEQF